MIVDGAGIKRDEYCEGQFAGFRRLQIAQVKNECIGQIVGGDADFAPIAVFLGLLHFFEMYVESLATPMEGSHFLGSAPRFSVFVKRRRHSFDEGGPKIPCQSVGAGGVEERQGTRQFRLLRRLCVSWASEDEQDEERNAQGHGMASRRA